MIQDDNLTWLILQDIIRHLGYLKNFLLGRLKITKLSLTHIYF